MGLLTIILYLISFFSFSNLFSDDSNVINIYTSRHYRIDEKIYKEYEDETGIKINVSKGKAKALIKRLSMGESQSHGDILFLVDPGRLVEAKQNNLFQKINNSFLKKSVPRKFRDRNGYWYGVTKRARVLVYNPKKVKGSDFRHLKRYGYDSLISRRWKGRILVRSSSNTYNQTLLASMYSRNPSKARKWTVRVKKNMARAPKGNDRDQIKAIVRGEGDIAIVNSYYLGLLRNSPDPKEREVGNSVKIFLPRKPYGVHMSISGAGILRWSKNKKEAIDLLEYLLSKNVQRKFMLENYEYPMNPRVELMGEVKSWGKFREDRVNVSRFSKYYSKIMELFSLADWK